MAGRGMHFALDEQEDELFRSIRGPDGVVAFVEVVCERIKKPWHQESDKAWEPIHRALTDGYLHYGRSPLYRCILGNKNYAGEGGWHFVNYVKAADVAKVAAALGPIAKGWLRDRYWAIDPKDYEVPLSDEDFEYTWHWFKLVRRFYDRAAKANRGVLFDTDL